MMYVLDVPPYPKQRPRMTRSGMAYTPKKTKANEKHIKAEIRAIMPRTEYEEPVALHVDFYLPKPKSAKKRPYPNVRPDLDNYIKQICDAGNGYLWTDDGHICAIFARKLYDGKPRIEVSIKPLLDHND